MKLLFVGDLDIHAQALLPFLSDHGYEVYIINLSTWFFPKNLGRIPVRNLYQSGTMGDVIRGRASLLRKALLFSCERFRNKLVESVRTLLPEGQIDMVYGSWGSTGLQELWALRSLSLPTAYEFLTFPTYTSAIPVLLENTLNCRPIRALSGRIFSTQNMQEYMARTFGLGEAGNIVFCECYPESFHYRERLPALSNLDGEPHVVFIGLDAHEMLPFLQDSSRNGVNLYVCDSTGFLHHLQEEGELDNVHFYERFGYERLSNAQFATFLTQFDACLVTYSFRGVHSFQRFENSLPNRFTIALTSGIPIAVAGSLKGCGSFVRKNGIGFTFNTAVELASALRNVESLGRLRTSAERFSVSFTLENKFREIDDFLQRVANGAGSGKG